MEFLTRLSTRMRCLYSILLGLALGPAILGVLTGCPKNIRVSAPAAPLAPVSYRCSVTPAAAFPGEPVTITGTISHINPMQHVEYRWEASGFSISGNGSTVTADTSKLGVGSHAIVGYAVLGSGPGQTVTCSATLTVSAFMPLTVSCGANPQTIRPGEMTTIAAQAITSAARPLTYRFAASAGTISESANTAKLSTGSTLPGSTIFVVCTVSNDRGQTASAPTLVHVDTSLSATLPPAPTFPWPPPNASARCPLPRLPSVPGRPAISLGDIDAILSAALDATGYGEKGYYSVPGGFALATRLEQIYRNGKSVPPPARFSLDPVTPSIWSLDYFRALFTTTSGYFRVIVFIVSDQPFTERPTPPTENAAIHWPSGGTNVLPHPIAATKTTDQVAITAMIYEFKSAETDGSPQQLQPLANSDLNAKTHLQEAGLWRALGLH